MIKKSAPTHAELVYDSQQAHNLSITLTNNIQLLSYLLPEMGFSVLIVIFSTPNGKTQTELPPICWHGYQGNSY